MNTRQRAIALALRSVRLAPFSADRAFVRSMAYAADMAPHLALSARQRWYLDALAWKYRVQLAGMTGLGFELPTEAPREDDYLTAEERRAKQFSFWLVEQ